MNTIIAQAESIEIVDLEQAVRAGAGSQTSSRDKAQLVYLEESELAYVGGGNLAHNY